MDIFEYNEVRWPTRALQQEEEEQAVGSAEQHLQPPVIEWVAGAEPVGKPQLLVVAMSAASCALLESCLAAAGVQEVATVHSQSSSTAHADDDSTARSSAAAGAAAAASASLYSTQLDQTQQLQPQRLLLLGSMQAEQYRGEADPSQEFLAFLLQSSSARQPAAAAAAPYLPSGSVVSGLPAALISQAELRGVPAELLVVVESVPALVPATLHELSALISAALKGAGGSADASAAGGAALLRLQQEAVLGAARAKLQQGSCRPSSVYS
ncbi:hypothetical protein OEZ86_002646 [Tetradesmus obliquus]|uniref:Proteasome assembly chaperone 1 n=1 Tax=Tetradesmus obliquus TaxID=3088 RepID=A0ABY8TRN6_TETOB|nr:hypothetical protein OEZ85_011748 [Tetradesmus obliquus]WIA31774.1 hypothetical protein OEZ86_002646 [Tetradesmus obliquus]